MIPYRDENQTRRTPLVTFVLIGLNVASRLVVQGAGMPVPLAASVCNYGLIAGELTGTVRPGKNRRRRCAKERKPLRYLRRRTRGSANRRSAGSSRSNSIHFSGCGTMRMYGRGDFQPWG